MGERNPIRSLGAGLVLAFFYASSVRAQVAPPAQAPESAAPAPSAPVHATPSPPAPAHAAPATAAFPVPAAVPAPPPPAPVEAPRKARVRFTANEPGALLESDTTPDGKQVAWYVVCEAPCTTTVSKQGALRVSGASYHPSRLFRIPDERSEIALDAEMEHKTAAVPLALMVVGGVVAGAGAMLALGGIVEEEETFVLAGSVVGGAGSVTAMIGAVMMIVQAERDESKTHVAGTRGLAF